MTARFRFSAVIAALLTAASGACLAEDAATPAAATAAGTQPIARPAQSADAMVAPIRRRKPARLAVPVSRPAVAHAAKKGTKTAGKSAKKARVRTTAAPSSVKN